MKTSKRVISLVLAAIMVMTSFAVGFPSLKIDAEAGTVQYDANGNIIIDGVTQERVVEKDNNAYNRTYAGYATDYLNGASKPTDIVIPGLNPNQDYVIQGMTYYPARDWMLVTAYHNDESASSKVFALDAATGNFVAMFSFENPDGSTNMDHGGGIAVSEQNIYYSCGDKDRKIAYAPISTLANAPLYEHTVIKLVDERVFYEVGSVADGDKTAYTAYVCYDQGVLWTGNFYDPGAIGGAIAADYKIKANADWDSMVWGYKLSGSTPEEEWANLVGAKGVDCQGNPSYAIALADQGDLDIKNVQYATVDNGKLYLSRSYGSGTGNSVTFGFDKTSHLTIADIDLSTPGNTTVTFLVDDAGNTRTINTAYTINTYEDHPMMPMSEGLCVIEDYIYITFEGASNKYMNESDGLTSIGNCQTPVDVIWKIDQYELVGEERPNEERAVYYEQVTSLSQITDGEEYVIAYESAEIDPVTQKPYMYLLDSNGGLKNYKLAKRNTTDTDGYSGVIGKRIIDYSVEDGKFYFYDPENDEIPGVRWTITGANSGNLRMENASTYFSEFRNFYFDRDKIAMAADGVSGLSNMHFYEIGNGKFYIYYDEDNNIGTADNQYYLWCNDGTTADYNSRANSWYASNDSIGMYDELTETPGTIHTNALNTGASNVIGKSIDTFAHGEFYIYKRVVDEYISTKDSRVFTNMDAKLQEDGTYTITLDTYATGELQYQVLEKERPTDFIFVLDTSASMTNNSDCSGYQKYTGDLSAYSIAGDSDSPGDTGAGTWTGPMYVRIGDAFVQLSVEASSRGDDGNWLSHKYYKYYWIYGVYNGVTYYWVPNSTSDAGQGGYWSTSKPAESATMKIYGNSDSARAKGEIYRGEHYRFFNGTGTTRLCCMQTAMSNVISKIRDNASSTGMNHRIAVVQYGSDGADDIAWLNTGMYSNGSTSFIQYSGEGTVSEQNYANAFFNVDQFETVREIVWAMTTSGGDSDTFSNYGFDMANGIINNSGQDYLATGDRSVAVIMLTDGVPGKGGSDTASAITVADSAIAESFEAKSKGATVYSLQMGNNSIDGFSMNAYMDAVSSNYVTARSTTNLGEENPNDVEYRIDVPTGTSDMFNVIADNLFNSVQAGSIYGLVHLDEFSTLQEQLTAAFLLPDDWTAEKNVSYQFTPGSYDKIGRISWGTPVDATGLSAVANKLTRTITVSGYDYSDQYIGELHKGNKLTVTITGVLANPGADITNTSINETASTAIFTDQEWFEDGRAFKRFPTKYFNIPEYTYVLDYGIQMYDANVNGTLLAVNDAPAKLNVADYKAKLPYTQASENGLVEITNNNLDLLYSTTPTNFADSGYCFIQRGDGTYDWFEIKVVPASNVLFEEDYIENKDGSAGVAWSKDGTTKTDSQTLTNNETDIYGYDAVYDDGKNTHSYGSAAKATVTTSSKRSVTKTFDFIGDGIDLISACGANTGIMIVKISGGNLAQPRAYIVDTYYGDSTVGGGMVYQTPIVSFRAEGDNAHGTYTVEVTAAYLSSAGAVTKAVKGSSLANGKLSATTGVPVNDAELEALLAQVGMEDIASADLEMVWFDDNSILNGGTGAAGNVKTTREGETVTSLDCYLDGFRTYHPMKTANDDYIDSEKNAQYINVLDRLIEVDEQTGTPTLLDGIAYVAGQFKEDESGVKPSLSFANYQELGPQNEFYLNAGNNGVVVKVALPNPNSKVQLGLRAVTGKANVTVSSDAGARSFEVNSATEMYYDISSCLSGSSPEAIITIKSTEGLLAVNNIKLTGDATAVVVEESDLEEAAMFMTADPVRANVVNGVVTPVTDDATEPDDGNTSIPGGDVIGNAPSFVQELLAKLFEILSQVFAFLPVGEVM